MNHEKSTSRILLLNYEFPPLGGGASPVSYEIAFLLSQKGYYIDVVTMGYRGLSKLEKINNYLRIHRVACLRTKKEMSFPLEQLSYLVSGFLKCRKLIKQNKYDKIHCHFIIPTGILALVLKKKYGLRYIITSHGSDVIYYNPRFKRLYPLLKPLWRSIVKNASKITASSAFLQKKILTVDKTIPDEKITVIPNGFNPDKFLPLEKQKYILVVSRLMPQKGVENIIEALRYLNLGEWKLHIVGEGPSRHSLEQLVKKYQLQNQVTFFGWIDNNSQQMKTLYGHASIFMLASQFENMNISLLEAMASECAIIASDVGGNAEVLKESGILVPFRAHREMSVQIKKLIQNAEQRREYGNAARQRLVHTFDWNTIIRKYQDILA